MELNLKQTEAMEHGSGPLLIAAGAGSGKTRTLTSRLLCLLRSGARPRQIIAITFTNKAAGEMRERIMNQEPGITGLFIGTFHSLGAKILRENARHLGRTADFTIYDEDDSLRLLKKNAPKNCDFWQIKQEIRRAKNELLDKTEDRLANTVFKKYDTALRENNVFDFDDLIEKTVRLFREQPAVLQKCQNRWQQILVDEFQDVNTAEYWLIKLLAEKHRNLSVVGDDFQSIFAFKGSDFRNFLNFEHDWPEAKLVLLEENYRSTANIIQAANEVIKNNQCQKKKNLWTKNIAGELIKAAALPDEAAEASFIAAEVSRLPQKNIAILYRTNAQSRALEQALLQREIPYQIFGGLRFYDRKEIKDILAGLRVAVNPQDTVSAERLQKTFFKRKSEGLINELPRLTAKLSILELINHILQTTDYFEYLKRNYPNAEERTENIQELIRFAANFDGDGGLAEFLEKTSLVSSLENPRSANDQPPVNLMTIHLAKGLEFDAVFVAGCNEGTLPHHRSYANSADIEEERRLMYVAMTRAKNQLCLTFCHRPSRFLLEIPPQLLAWETAETEEESWIEY